MIEQFDAVILDFFQGIQSDALTIFMKIITALGELGWCWIVLSIVLIVRKSTRKMGIIMLVSLVLSVIVGNGILKNLVQRPRPYWRNPAVPLLISEQKDFSFPSGHSTASFCAAFSLVYCKSKGMVPGLLLALIIAISRLYFYVHYPTDILAGILLGAILAGISFWIVGTIYKQREEKKKLLQ